MWVLIIDLLFDSFEKIFKLLLFLKLKVYSMFVGIGFELLYCKMNFWILFGIGIIFFFGDKVKLFGVIGIFILIIKVIILI